jgi:hypothetical protein
MKSAKKHSPFGRAAFAHLLRYPAQLDFSVVYIISVSRQGLAVPKYSCAPECLANERMRRVKYVG